MEYDRLSENDEVVKVLWRSVRDGETGLGNTPEILKRILTDGCWRERYIRHTQQLVAFDRFEQFVTAGPPEGLGATIERLRRLCAGDAAAVDALDQAIQSPVGRPPSRESGVNHPTNERDRSTKQIRRLRSEFPAVHARVLNGEIPTSRAAVEAGIYPRRVSINLGSAPSAAATIRAHSGPEFVQALIAALMGD